jgi:long-chain acyl-CoA synthetase
MSQQPGAHPPADVAARLRQTAAERPDHVALRWDAGEVTYGELHARVDAGTAALQALGVAPGGHVAFVLGTTPTFVEVAAAVLRAGAAMVPLLPGLAPDELRFAITDCGAEVVIVGPERLDALVAMRGELSDVRHVLAADVPELPAGLGTDVDPEAPSVASWTQACEAASREGEPRRVERSHDDLAALVYTSGTTGRPRGAMLTRGNLAANQDQSLAGRFEVGADDVILLVLPLAHIYSLNVGLGAAITAGATMVLVERFDPEACLEAISRHEVTVVLGAPPMYAAWVAGDALERADLSSVRLAVSGAAPLPIPVIERFRELTGITIEEGYGLTEASPSVSSTSMADRAVPGSVGLPLPDVEVRLVGEDGHDVEPGDDGELWVRGPNVFQGYWNDPEATALALTPDGWLRTGDVAIRDEDGLLYLVDRLKDLVIVNGFNVYPREVERVLLSSGVVAQAAVVGVPHPLTGEALVAFVVPLPDAEVDVDVLEARCREQLARYKWPTRIEVVDDLPTTATGKVRRVELRES